VTDAAQLGDIVGRIRVPAGEPAAFARRDPADKLGLEGKGSAGELVARLLDELRELQARLWAEDSRAVLLILQGLDASGKDGTIRRVFSGLNPQGCHVSSFGVPSELELEHDYLWRIHQACPRRGQIGIFNRSHYEDVGVVRVKALVPEERWRRRFRHIREFERMLVEEGTTLVKVFLHMSKEEQRAQLQERLDDPTKTWKFRLGDLEDRERWDDFMAAYDEAIAETSSDWAPWHVVPADRKWARDAAVAALLVDTLRRLDPRYPDPPAELRGVTVR
jgi:PPK2 family polyphosphate:nucleotide phosphotransferase